MGCVRFHLTSWHACTWELGYLLLASIKKYLELGYLLLAGIRKYLELRHLLPAGNRKYLILQAINPEKPKVPNYRFDFRLLSHCGKVKKKW